MSDLPFLPSDDDDDETDNNDAMGKDKLNGNNNEKRKQSIVDHNDDDNHTENDNNNNEDDDDEDEDNADDFYEMNDSFQFGGILGEDGVGGSSAGNNGSCLDYLDRPEQGGWSYQKLIEEQQQRDIDAQNPNSIVPRMNIRDIIDAKRKTLVQAKKKKNTISDSNTTAKEKSRKVSIGDDDDDDDNSENSEDQSESSSDDDDDEEEDDVDDEEKTSRPQDDDVVRTRESKLKKGKPKKVSESNDDDANKENEDTEDDDEGNDDNDDDEVDNDNNNFDTEEAVKAAAFFEKDTDFTIASGINTNGKIEMFSQLSISRPILRGIASMGFVTPTPIQARVIPLALAGRDVCASAVTGSGKTAAFLVPILERLIHRSRGNIKSRNNAGSATRAVVLTPTRELAAQCISMLSSLRQFLPDIRSCLIVGGTKNVQGQAAELRTRPDIVVATPGRLLDHLMNSTGCTLDDVEMLVLDEADRLLDLGFQEEVMEIIKSCNGGSNNSSNSHRRQTLLFSATMNTKVDDLIKLSLRRPVRVHVTGSADSKSNNDSNKDSTAIEVAPRLEQEFIRIRSSYNDGIYREAVLLSLLTRTYTNQTIVFFDTKVVAHRLMIICGLCNIKCTELHGNLTQQQRLVALEEFRNGTADVLLATDLAARGLDIDRVKAVINFEMPLSVETYVHRIGRTARAGRGGRSCTLISEARRHLMKDIIKDANTTSSSSSDNTTGKTKSVQTTKVIRSRTVPATVIEHFAAKIRSLEQNIEEVVQAEAVAKMDRVAEMELVKAQNMIEFEDDIKNRPNREWFQSEFTKRSTKKEAAERAKAVAEKAGTGMHKMTRKKRRAREAIQALQDSIRGDDDNGDDDEDERMSAKKRKQLVATTPVAIKATAKQEKRKKQSESHNDKSLSDEAFEREMKLLQKNKKSKKKMKASENPIGDSSLFDDDKITYQSKKQEQKKNTEKDTKNGNEENADGTSGPAKSAYNFRGFDPSKKLGKKKGHKAFKSRSKFKRRK